MYKSNKITTIIRIICLIFIITFTLMCFGDCYTSDGDARSIEPIRILILSMIQLALLFVNKTWAGIVSCIAAGWATLYPLGTYALQEIGPMYTILYSGPSVTDHEYKMLFIGNLAVIFSFIIFFLQIILLILFLRFKKTQNNSL